nr:BtpA/SgcQ family protein [Halobacillus sp. A1]
MIHLPPLPGSYQNTGNSVEEISKVALEEAQTFERYGVTSVMIQNSSDIPYSVTTKIETIASLSVIGKSIKDNTNLEVGVNISRNDSNGSIAVAKAINGSFVRIKYLTGAFVTAEGILEGDPATVLDYRTKLHGNDIKIWADIYKDNNPQSMISLTIEEQAKNSINFGKAEGLIITGKTDVETIEMLKRVRRVTALPLIVGGGVNASNITSIVEYADGAIIGSYFRRNNSNLEISPLDERKIQELVEMV